MFMLYVQDGEELVQPDNFNKLLFLQKKKELKNLQKYLPQNLVINGVK